ncbi:RNA-binding domain-containing protein [Ramaria rubella]|nr:RNA-binding domain-containing protein [Ramaria rubella]
MSYTHTHPGDEKLALPTEQLMPSDFYTLNRLSQAISILINPTSPVSTIPNTSHPSKKPNESLEMSTFHGLDYLQPPQPSKMLGVFGLPPMVEEEDIRCVFSHFGEVLEATLIFDAKSRGFGFVRMASIQDATRCIIGLNNTSLSGRLIRVDYSVTNGPIGEGSRCSPPNSFQRYRPY